MSVTDWSPQPSGNAVADRAIPARDGLAGREVPEAIRGLMAKTVALALDQGGALLTEGTSNAYTVSSKSGFSRLIAGVQIALRFDRENTSTATLNLDGLGPKPICDADGLPLLAGHIKSGRAARASYDAEGDRWRLDLLSALDNTSDAQKVAVGPIADALESKFTRGQTLSDPFSSAFIVSPLIADAYASGPERESGLSSFVVINRDDNPVSGKERYAAWFAYTGAGTGDPSVIGSSFGLGVSNLKKNWFNTTIAGQTIGLHIVTRGGYFGADANAPLGQFGGYNPAGDVTSIIVNSVQSSPYGQQAAGEFSIHYANQGRFDNSGNIHSINMQLCPMRMLNPDGTIANPGIGIALTASAGSLGYAIQIVNTARPGSYNNNSPGIWRGGFRYNYDDGGTRAPFDAFRVDQDGTLYLSAGAGSAPSKKIRAANNGTLQILSDAGAVIQQIGDNGSVYMPPNAQVVIAGVPALNVPASGYGAATGAADKSGFDAGTPLTTAQLTAKLAALWQASFNKQHIGA